MSVPMFISWNGNLYSQPGLSVMQAYVMDTKVDDGFPQQGRVTAMYLSSDSATAWARYTGNFTGPAAPQGAAPGVAASASSITCYDNGNNAANTMVYSTTIQQGSGINCALSFKID